jgi:ComF family protein
VSNHGARLLLRRAWDGTLDLIFPPTCVHCRRVGSFFCTICREDEVHPIEFARSTIAGIDGFTALATHEGAIRSAVHALKYEYVLGVAVPLMAQLAPQIQWTFDAIIPVPLHYSRLKERGYNQANILAQALSERSNHPVMNETLIRRRATQSQVGLGASERRENVAGAFEVVGDVAPTVLLIDDVCTTGSTLSAASQALKAAGVETVYAATVALAQ